MRSFTVRPRKALGLLLLVPMLTGFVITSSTSASAQTVDTSEAELVVVDRLIAAVGDDMAGADLDAAIAKLNKKDKNLYDRSKARAEAIVAQLAAAADPAAAYAALSEKDQKLYNRASKPVSVRNETADPVPAPAGDGDGDGDFSIMSTGCWNVTDNMAWETVYQADAIKMWMETRTCFNSDGRVNSDSRITRTWGTTHVWGWVWDTTYQQRWERFGAITHKAIWQGHFYFSFDGKAVNAENHMYPCLKFTIQGTSGAPTATKQKSCAF